MQSDEKKNYFETKIKKNILKSKVLFILRFFLKFTKMYVSVSYTYTYININMNFSVNIYFFNIIILNIKYINTLIFQYIFLFFFCRNFPLSVYIIFLYNFSIHLTSMINKEDNNTLNTYLHNVFAFVYVCAPCICTRTSLLVE